MDLDRLKGRAQDLLRDNADKIEKGVGKAETFAKSRTPKQSDRIDKVAGRIRGLIPDDAPGHGKGAPATTQPPTTQPPTTQPPTTQPPTTPPVA